MNLTTLTCQTTGEPVFAHCVSYVVSNVTLSEMQHSAMLCQLYSTMFETWVPHKVFCLFRI